MNKEEILNQIQKLSTHIFANPIGGLIQAKQFAKTYIGSDNHFSEAIFSISTNGFHDEIKKELDEILWALRVYVEDDLHREISIQREIQIDTVSDYLDQAETLLNDKNVHPAAPAVLIGASLEEFLRTWLEELGCEISKIKRGLDSYTSELRIREKISKQDVKDLSSWGGTRNDAAHGYWDNVNDKQRIRLMLEGVNLFIRKYSGK